MEKQDKRKIITIISVLIALVFLVSSYSIYNVKNVKEDFTVVDYKLDIGGRNTASWLIREGLYFEQTMKGDIGIFNAFELSFGTSGRKNTSLMFVKLRDNTTGKYIGEWTVKPNTVENDAWHKFKLPDYFDGSNGDLTLSIESNAVDDNNTFIVWLQNYSTSEELGLDDYRLFINGNQEWYKGFSFRTCEDFGFNYSIFWQREILVVSYLLIISCFFVAIIFLKKMSFLDILVKYRFVLIGFSFIFFLVFKIHCFSLSVWDEELLGIEYGNNKVTSLFGTQRMIFSDAYAIIIPQIFSQCDEGFPLFNSVTGTNAVLAGLPVLDFTIIGRPSLWGFLLLGKSRGLVWLYWFRLFSTFLCTFEIGKFISKSSKCGFLGAFIFTFSSLFLWWSNHALCEVIIYFQILLVGFIIYLENNGALKKKIIGGVLFTIGLLGYVLVLYPALQVPLGFILIILVSCLLIKNRKNLVLNKHDAIIITSCLCFALFVLLWFFFTSKGSLHLILNTEYPGNRVDQGGGFEFYQLGTYFVQYILPFKDIASIVSNNCEISSLFPFTLIMLLFFPFVLYKKDIRVYYLEYIFYFFYVICFSWRFIEFPVWFAKITLFSYIAPKRLPWLLGLMSIYLLMMTFKLTKNDDKKIYRISFFVISFISLILLFWGFESKIMVKYLETYYWLCLAISMVLVLVFAFAITQRKKMLLAVIVAIYTISFLPFVVPVNVGNSSYFNHEVSARIREIKEEDSDAYWVFSGSFPWSNYLCAHNVRCFNTTTNTPDFDKWRIIDPNEEYSYYWNRYTQVGCSIGPNTEFKLLADEYIFVVLDIEDLKNLNVSYILSTSIINDEHIILKYAYSKSNLYIYEVNL